MPGRTRGHPAAHAVGPRTPFEATRAEAIALHRTRYCTGGLSRTRLRHTTVWSVGAKYPCGLARGDRHSRQLKRSGKHRNGCGGKRRNGFGIIDCAAGFLVVNHTD